MALLDKAYIVLTLLAMCLSFGSLFTSWSRERAEDQYIDIPRNMTVDFEQTMDYYLTKVCYECDAGSLYRHQCVLESELGEKVCSPYLGVPSPLQFIVLEILLLIIAVWVNVNAETFSGGNQKVRNHLFFMPIFLAVLLNAISMIAWELAGARDNLSEALVPSLDSEGIQNEPAYTGIALQLVSLACKLVALPCFTCCGIVISDDTKKTQAPRHKKTVHGKSQA